MNNWDSIFFGNPLKDWAIALSIMIASFAAILIFNKIFISWFKKWAAKSENTFDDFVIQAIQKFIVPFLYYLSLFFAIHYLTFTTQVSNIMRVAMLFITSYFILRFITAAISYTIFNVLDKQENSDSKQRQANGLIIILKSIVWILGLVFLLNNLGYNVTAIITGLGIGGIAIALAAQAILGDIFSYFVIFFDKPFEIGDFITVGDKVGTVEYIGIKTTRIKAIGGEQIICANKDLTDSRVHNYKRMAKRRVLFQIGVTYQTSTAQIKKIPDIIKGIITGKENVDFDRSHFSGFGDFSLNFETAYYVAGSDFVVYMDAQQKIYIELLEAFRKEGIEFAYPTQTLFATTSSITKKEEEPVNKWN